MKSAVLLCFALLLMTSYVYAQERCSFLRRCNNSCCVTNLMLMGKCSNGTEGDPCGGMNNCPCQNGAECQSMKCVAGSTTTSESTSASSTSSEETTASSTSSEETTAT